MEIQLAALAAPEDGEEEAEVMSPASVEATHRRSIGALLWTLTCSDVCMWGGQLVELSCWALRIRADFYFFIFFF